MTTVVVVRSDVGIVGLEASGHTGYAEVGSDIVCAAVSAVMLTALIGLNSVLGISARTVRRDHAGYLKITLPPELTEDHARDARLILSVAEAGLKAIENEHPGHVRVIARKRRKHP